MPKKATAQEGPKHGLERLLLDHHADLGAPILGWDDQWASRRQLTTAVESLASVLTELGAGASLPVACIVSSGPTAVAAMFATWLAGGVYVPLNGRLTDAELHSHLEQPRPAVVITSPGEGARVPPRYACVEEKGRWTWKRSSDRVTPHAVPLASDAALLMRTSGTVSAPKPVLLGHTGVLLGIDTVVGRLRNGASGPAARPRPNLIPTSLALWAGIWNTLFAFRIGAAVSLMERFNTLAYARLVKSLGVTSTVLVPAMITALADEERITDLAPLRYVRSITAPLLPEQARRFRARFGVTVLNSYGQTELGSEIAGWTTSDVRMYGDLKLGAVGRPHPGIDVRVVGDANQSLPAGQTGEVHVRSPFVFGEDSGHASDQSRLADGYLRTGDLGHVDEDGFLWIEGRVSEMINRGGLKIMPGEVEEVLRAQPAVADACVAGVPDHRLGEVPVAWLTTKPGVTVDLAQLSAALRKVLAGYKIPVDFRIVEGDFPRSEIGKVLRRELARDYVAAGHRQSPG